jgi:hypothetical protein
MPKATAANKQFLFDPDGRRSPFQDDEEPAPIDLDIYMKRSGEIIANAMDFRKRRLGYREKP